jgi:hypothetical protein
MDAGDCRQYKEGNMEQIIVGALALVALWWAVRGRSGKPVPARVPVVQRVSLRRRRNRF